MLRILNYAENAEVKNNNCYFIMLSKFLGLTFCWSFTWSDSFADCFVLKYWDRVLSLYRESKWMVSCWIVSWRMYFVWLNHCKMIGRHDFKSSTSCGMLCNLLKVFEVLLVFCRYFLFKNLLYNHKKGCWINDMTLWLEVDSFSYMTFWLIGQSRCNSWAIWILCI